MNRAPKLVLAIAAIAITALSLASDVALSRAPTSDTDVEMPHALSHAKSVADIFPPGR